MMIRGKTITRTMYHFSSPNDLGNLFAKALKSSRASSSVGSRGMLVAILMM